MRSDCLPTYNFEHWQREGHRIQRCDASTGHTVTDVAFCNSEETAKRILQAIKTDLE